MPARSMTRSLALAVLALALCPRALHAQTALKITSFSPAEASYLGKTPFEVRGTGFTPSTRIIIDATSVTPTFVDSTKLTGLLPPHDPTTAAIPVIADGGAAGRSVLNRALQYIGPLTVSSASPARLKAGQGSAIVVRGIGFTPLTSVKVGSTPLADKVFLDARTIQGTAPALPEGSYDVTASEAAILGPPVVSTLPHALTYRNSIFPAPQQVETSLAEGTARLSWFNPMAYEAVEVLDKNGKLVKRLPGGATSIELPAASLDRIDFKLRGIVDSDNRTDLVDAIAKFFFCNPAPLAGNGTVGELDLSLRGAHDAAEVDRCGPDGSGSSDGHGAIAGGPISIADLGSHGAYVPPGGRGMIQYQWQRQLYPESNSLVTGFLLKEDALVLEISGFYEKVANFPGLELRGRITQMATPENPHVENGFTDEFTFPSVTLAGKKEWHSVNYYRADKDVSHVPDPDDPSDTQPQPCRDENNEVRRIPHGEYLLELYAVGGNVLEQYFTFANDGRDYELLIPGATCPPYPLVKVTDMTGHVTLPVITGVDAHTLSVDAQGKPLVHLTASGTWLDEAANVQYVGPGFDDNPDFEYFWSVQDLGGNAPRVSSGSSSSFDYKFRDWGCYYIDLTVKDKGCSRSVTRSYQVAITPESFSCTNGNPYFSFLFPTPEPSGICAVVGLDDPAPGNGKMANPRPVEFRVFVAPRYSCEGKTGPAAFIGDGTDPDVEFTLATPFIQLLPGGGAKVVYVKVPGVDITLSDLCSDVDEGPKYLHVRIEDLGRIPEITGADGGHFRSVYFVGRSLHYYDDDGVRSAKLTNDLWRPIGPPLRLTNHPPLLDNSYWAGVFEPQDATYYFSVQAGPQSRQSFPIGKSKEVPLPIEDAPGDISIPSFDNGLTTGFNARFKVHQEEFLPDDGTGGTFGESFGNKIEGAGMQLPPTSIGGGAAGGEGGGGEASGLAYQWDDCRDIFKQELRQTLFESILYTGTIGPVPVTVWASIGLGIDFLMQAHTTALIDPLGILDEQPFVKSDAALFTRVGVSVPCEIRADVLFGVASISARLIPQATVTMKAHVGITDVHPEIGAAVKATLSLLFEVEACIWALVDEICYSPGAVKILDEETLLEWGTGDHAPDVAECASNAGAGAALAGPDGGGAINDPTFKLVTSSRPGVAVSPDGQTTLYTYSVEVSPDSFDGARTLGAFHTEGQQVFNVAQAIHDGIDPASSFLSSSAAMVVWTRGGIPDGVIPVFDEIDRRNIIAAHQDVMITVHRKANAWAHQGEASYVLVSDRPDEVPAGQKQADGMATIGADLSAAAQQAGGQALVAWVRYEAPFLVQDGTKTKVYNRTLRQQDGRLKPYFQAAFVDTTRPNMEHTAIYARRMGPSGPLSAQVKISSPGVGINIEPTISVSPSGNVAYCIWVHGGVDPATGEQLVNMTDTNMGRSLQFAVYSKATGAWSAPQTIDSIPSAGFPAALEPSLSLKSDNAGLLAFTAVRAGSPTTDSGLAGSRYVFACRLTNGVFGEPILIHGKCLSPETGHWPQVAWASPIQDIDLGGLNARVASAEFVLTYLGTGPSGVRAGSGNLMMTALGGGGWTSPRSLTSDDNIHSNFAAAVSPSGRVRTIHLNGGSSKASILSGGGGALSQRTLETGETWLLPDAAINATRLSDPFAAPGSKVQVAVEIENLGFAATPVDAGGNSLLAVKALFIGEDGKERAVAQAFVRQLQAGESSVETLEVQVPHDPVLLRVVLSPNPVDMDGSNNQKDSFLGAPAPKDVACDIAFYSKGEGAEGVELRSVARLSWKNPALYDEVRIYRDGSMLTALTGGATLFVDTYVEPGEHSYEVRGVIGVSKSRKVACVADVTPPPGGLFRRGDTNASGQVDISDAVATLGYLFLGSDAPPCLDAADADDDGELSITDAIRVLGYLFAGMSAPPAPGPDACGVDPTPDSLAACGGGCAS